MQMLQQKQTQKTKKTKENPEEIKKKTDDGQKKIRRNPFLFYTKAMTPSVKQQQPTLRNSEIFKILG